MASVLDGVFLFLSNFGMGELGATVLVLLVLDVTPWWEVRVIWLDARVGDIVVGFRADDLAQFVSCCWGCLPC